MSQQPVHCIAGTVHNADLARHAPGQAVGHDRLDSA